MEKDIKDKKEGGYRSTSSQQQQPSAKAAFAQTKHGAQRRNAHGIVPPRPWGFSLLSPIPLAAPCSLLPCSPVQLPSFTP